MPGFELLQGIENFTYERLKELAEFGKSESNFEMMAAEVLKEVATRFKISLSVDAKDNNHFYCTKKGAKIQLRSSVKVVVSIQGWGAPATFEMCGEHHLEELNEAAQMVGAKRKPLRTTSLIAATSPMRVSN